MSKTQRFFNRELSWLAFNGRVLEEATNLAHPLLERLRFLSISGANLDEFFMVRVAGLKGQELRGIETKSADGMKPTQQLAAIAVEANRLMAKQQEVWTQLRQELSKTGINLIGGAEVYPSATEWLYDHFREQILPVLTPQAIDPAHPFPFIPNKGFSLVFNLRRMSDSQRVHELLMVPATLPRFVRIPGKEARYIAVEVLIGRHLQDLFPGYEVLAQAAFRIIRDSDVEVEEEGEDLVQHFQDAIRRRRRGRVIKLEVHSEVPPELESLVRGGLLAGDALVSELSGFLGMSDLAALVEEDRPDLKFPSYTPRFPERIREHGGDCFEAIAAKDIVVHHPYESFDVVVEFVEQAARDPNVVAIKQTLYRAGRDSPVVRALIDAAEKGKSVTAVIELKARFDEEQNLLWANALERAGAQVIYGFVRYKTHAKACLVVRREAEGYRSYCHLGTGNYHPITARVYTDLSFFTADPRVGEDVRQLFNYITGYVEPQGLKLITMSPLGIRDKLCTLIDQEIVNARSGKPAAIWAKVNALVDRAMIERLYEASAAGVQIDLVVRGICCLRPGVAGLSENIRVKSIVGRFLEHGRIWAFANGEQLPHRNAMLFISSADWMPRNLDRRVEYMLKVENPTVHMQVLDQVLVANILDNEQSWKLLSDGSYERVSNAGARAFNLHRYFMTNPSLSGQGASHHVGVPELPEDLAGTPPEQPSSS